MIEYFIFSFEQS